MQAEIKEMVDQIFRGKLLYYPPNGDVEINDFP